MCYHDIMRKRFHFNVVFLFSLYMLQYKREDKSIMFIPILGHMRIHLASFHSGYQYDIETPTVMLMYRFPSSQIACQHYWFSPTNHPHNQWPMLFLVWRLECATGRVLHASLCRQFSLLSNSLNVYTYIFAYRVYTAQHAYDVEGVYIIRSNISQTMYWNTIVLIIVWLWSVRHAQTRAGHVYALYLMCLVGEDIIVHVSALICARVTVEFAREFSG